MAKIKVMDVNLSNKIAAGEVVESLMNVVKELVENSIDADSKRIKVYLKECGVREIKVVDDGVGMDRDDAISCLKRHATSKIYNDDDLFNINTLGFRGEALPSIASVSKMTIETCFSDCGTIIKTCGGEVVEVSSSSLRKGTVVCVCDLFYNTPARLKYLRSLHTELSNIVSYINKMALCYPGIKFELYNDDKCLLNTSGSGNLLKVISNIYGLDVVKKMIKLSFCDGDYDVFGYVSYPEVNRAKSHIVLFVNGRYVKNNELVKTILEAYHTYLPINRYPIVVLNIELDPSIVDVNVHPTKMEVKFSKIYELKELIFDNIKMALKKLVLVPEIKASSKVVTNIDKVTSVNDEVDFKEEVVKPIYEDVSFDFEVNDEEEEYKERDGFCKITPVGIVHSTYIVGENDKGMYIIDQHAANERVNYENYLKELGKDDNVITSLLVPIKLEFSNLEYMNLKDKLYKLDELGIGYEMFGINTLVIRSHPSWLGDKYVTEKLRKIIEVILKEKDFSKEKFNERIAINLSCKMAIKANDYISLLEAEVLLDKLLRCDNPYTCPHGRPTIISYSYYELEKLFKRVM